MDYFMEYVNRGIWHCVVNGYIIPTQVVDDKTIKKPFESWTTK